MVCCCHFSQMMENYDGVDSRCCNWSHTSSDKCFFLFYSSLVVLFCFVLVFFVLPAQLPVAAALCTLNLGCHTVFWNAAPKKKLGDLSFKFTWTCFWKPGSSSIDIEIHSVAGWCVVLYSILLLLWCATPLTFSSLTFFAQDILGPPAVVRLVCAAKGNLPQKIEKKIK